MASGAMKEAMLMLALRNPAIFRIQVAAERKMKLGELCLLMIFVAVHPVTVGC